MADFVLIGGGGHARVVLNVLRRLGHSVLGFSAPKPAGARVNLPYLGRDEDLLKGIDASRVHLAFALGKVDTNSSRLRVLDTLVRAGFRSPPIVAPTATVHDDVVLGDGSVVLDGSIIVTGARLGRGCIVNTHATVDHDCTLGDDVHVACGATLSGDVWVGDRCMIGAGATVIHGVRITSDCMVGAGATVVRDILEPGNYVGTPTTRIR